MRILEASTQRVTETPNAVMTTLSSPTLGGIAQSVGLVDMRPGAEGPVHAFDCELIWAVTDGEGLLRHDDRETPMCTGTTLVLPAGEMRQFVGGKTGFRAVVVGQGGATVTRADGQDGGTPPWAA